MTEGFWFPNIKSLFENMQIIPLGTVSIEEQLNAITRLILYLCIILWLLDFSYTPHFLLSSLLLIILIYYIQKKVMRKTKHEEYTRIEGTDKFGVTYDMHTHESTSAYSHSPGYVYTNIPRTQLKNDTSPIIENYATADVLNVDTSPYNMKNLTTTNKGLVNGKMVEQIGIESIINNAFCNDEVTIDPPTEFAVSLNQNLTGNSAHPVTRIPPVVIPPTHDLSYWRDNNAIVHSRINDPGVQQEMYLSGYAVSTCCGYLGDGSMLVPDGSNMDEMSKENYAPPYDPANGGMYAPSMKCTGDRAAISGSTTRKPVGRRINAPRLIDNPAFIPAMNNGEVSTSRLPSGTYGAPLSQPTARPIGTQGSNSRLAQQFASPYSETYEGYAAPYDPANGGMYAPSMKCTGGNAITTGSNARKPVGRRINAPRLIDNPAFIPAMNNGEVSTSRLPSGTYGAPLSQPTARPIGTQGSNSRLAQQFASPYIEGFEMGEINVAENEPGWVDDEPGYNPEQLYTSGLPTNYPASNCEQSPDLKRYNENLFTEIVTPGVYTTQEIIEPINSNIGISFQQQFEPTTCKRDKHGLMYTQHDPRLYEEDSQEDYENGDSAPNVGNIYDPRFYGYGTSYRSYLEPTLGQTRFLYDDVNAIKMPNYVTRSKVDFLPYADTYGPMVEGSEYGNVHNPHIRSLVQDSWMRDSLQFRNDLTERRMRKINANAWQKRKMPNSARPVGVYSHK